MYGTARPVVNLAFLTNCFVRDDRCKYLRLPLHSYDQWPNSKHFWHFTPFGKAAAILASLQMSNKKKQRTMKKKHTQIRTMEKCQVWIGKPSGKPKGWFRFCWWSIYLRFLPSFWAAIPPIVIVSGACFGPFRRYGGCWRI